MRALLWTITIFIFGFLQYSLFFGENGLIEYQISQKKIALLQNQNQITMDENQKLRDEVSDYKSGLQEIETEARYQLGMIKEGESFLWIPDANNSDKKNLIE